MSPNRYSVSAVSTAKTLKTPLKASVVILTTVILASCSSSSGDNAITPKPTPTIPVDNNGTGGVAEGEGSGGSGSDGGGVGTTTEAEKAIKAAEAKTKAAEEALKVAEAKTKVAEAALKAAEAGFGQESEKAAEASRKAIDAAKEEAAKAKIAAEAARVEAVTKIEAAAKASKTKVDTAKKTAADAVAKVKAAEEKAKAADNRATVAEAKAKEVEGLLKAEMAAKKAAQVKTKAAEAETKKAQDKANTAAENAAKATKDANDAKAEATKKIAAIEKASASQIASAKKAVKDAQDALKTAEAQAITAAKAAAKAATDAAEAAAKEAAVKLEAIKTASATQIDAAKKEADAAQARADKAVENAAAAQKRVEAAEATAKLEADKAEEALLAKQNAEQAATEAQAQAALEKQKADKAQAEANKAKVELTTAQADLAAAEKALADALASGGGNTEALQAEVDRRQAALDTANAKIIAAEQAQADAATAAKAQVAAANQATQAAQDALAAAQIQNAPETKKSGVQSINVGTTAAGLPDDFIVTTRDFEIGENNVIARADIASGDLLPKVDVNISGAGDTDLQDGFKSHDDSTEITTALGVLPLTYTSAYKDFGDDMRIGHIDGAANLQGTEIPVNGVAVVGNATQAANMPTEGKVGYTGDATHRQLGIGNDIEFGKSVFTADFVAQNLKGDLTFDKAGKIGLTAGINGNQFSGSKDGYNAEGGFFGGDGQYLGGVYEGHGAQGTYGAKSDKQTAAEQAAAEAQADADNAQAAIADAQAQANAAQAAADKAKADAAKAQTALEKAEDALANAGNGEDQLAAALERAAAAEAAEAAALQAASTAEAARAAAQAAQVAAEQAQMSAEKAAEQAVGDAQDQKEAKEKALQAQKVAEDAKAAAETAKTEADKAKEEALKAKASAENSRDEAIARAEAAEAEAIEAANQFTAPDSRVSGFQSTSVNSEDSTFDNNSNSYNQLKVYANEVDDRASLKPINVTLKGSNDGADDKIYAENRNGFKEYKGDTSFEGRLGNTVHKRDFKYDSVYKNFDDQMQIGHIFGDIKNATIGALYNKNLSNTYVQGNATNLGDMDKLTNVNEGKANYKGVATYVEGGKIAVDGSSKFDVDFVAKSVKGELDFSDKQVDIAATISDNTFASEEEAAVNTVGGFFGKGAGLLGGVYEREDSSGYIKGTYGANKLDPSVEVVPDPVESKMTGFQSTALSSKEKTLPFGLGQLDNAIGYVDIRDDKSDWTELKTENGSEVPVDNGKGNNFNSFKNGVVRADMVKPDSVLKPIAVSLTDNGSVTVDAGKGGQNPTFNYNAVYKNFDSQMQVGHVYGNFNSLVGDVSRAANVYVEGYLTSQAGMDNLKNVNDGTAQYNGMATYIENIHLDDNASTAPVMNGESAFDIDFVNGSVDGTLSFTGTDYKYMPAGNEIKIDADITGNTFAGNKNGIDTAGGFYGEDAQFLGGVYQDAAVQGGKGTVAGTGTKFQGTFGAEKQ